MKATIRRAGAAAPAERGDGLMQAQGYGKGYKYAHDYDEHYVEHSHLPERLTGRRYYEPGELGFEAKIKEWWVKVREKRHSN